MPSDVASAAGQLRGFAINTPPAGFNPEKDLPLGFLDFYLPLHRQLTARQQELIGKRKLALDASLGGQKPNHLPPSAATKTEGRSRCRTGVPTSATR